MKTMDKKTKKYITNPVTGRPVLLFGKQHMNLIKINIMKDKLVKAPVLQFDKDESPEVLERVKNAMTKQPDTFIVKFRIKIITKNTQLTNEQLINSIINKYPNILNKTMEQISVEHVCNICTLVRTQQAANSRIYESKASQGN
jgi:hypothetical protein